MNSSFGGRAESDIYRMDVVDDSSSSSSSNDFDGEEELAEEMYNDDDNDHGDLIGASRQQQQQQQTIQQQQQQQPGMMMDKQMPLVSRPPPISTKWEVAASPAAEEGKDGDDDDGVEEEEVEVAIDSEQETRNNNNARVSFNVPPGNISNDTASSTAAAMASMQPSSMIHFQDPKRHANFTSPYPTQSLRPTNTYGSSAADAALEQVVTAEGRHHRPVNNNNGIRTTISYGRTMLNNNKTPSQGKSNNGPSSSLAEVTPAFLRRAAQDLGVADNLNNNATATTKSVNSNHHLQEPIPPNSLMNMNRRDRLPPANTVTTTPFSNSTTTTTNNNNSSTMNSSIPDSSFYGADASALDGTFVSIRDLNDDDDVPSVDNNDQLLWNSSSTVGNSKDGGVGVGSGADGAFPTESTSLLGSIRGGRSGGGGGNNSNNNNNNRMLPWQGGFFGSQMEKEDRRERRKMMMRGGKGRLSTWMWTLRSLLFWGGHKNVVPESPASSRWEQGANNHHPIGADFMTHRNNHTSNGGLPRQRLFSLFLIGVLCFHLALCGLHDLFVRYLSYRNPNNNDQGEEGSEVSWNGEGQYTPAYWMSFDGRVLNPFVGPGARTLTAFGALVPGLVLSKGQRWRVGTSLFQTSSFIQLLLHIWALKTVVGGSMMGLEWKRGTFVVSSLYLISAVVGSAWSIALEPGRLITTSGMGIAGLLTAAIVERACFPLASKNEEDDESGSHHNGGGHGNGGSNNAAVSSSSNEQFTFQPPNATKKKRRNPLKGGGGNSPGFLLLLELLASWWAAYTSLVGTAMAAMTGGACALLLFVGSPPPGSFDGSANQDLLFAETNPPPPPPPRGSPDWRSDDDSADTSIGAVSQSYKTPLMRRSILADEDDEEEPLGTRSLLRKRHVNGSSSSAYKTPNSLKGRMVSIKNKQSFSASRVIAHVIGVLLALLLTLIPASLIATGDGPSTEVTRASVLGCRPMRILYKEDDDSSDLFECAGGCIPLSRERMARMNEGMRPGRCDTIGYRCWSQSGTMTLRNYEVNVGIYVVPSADGSCGDGAYEDDGDGNRNNDDANVGEAADAYNGEVEGAQ